MVQENRLCSFFCSFSAISVFPGYEKRCVFTPLTPLVCAIVPWNYSECQFRFPCIFLTEILLTNGFQWVEKRYQSLFMGERHPAFLMCRILPPGASKILLILRKYRVAMPEFVMLEASVFWITFIPEKLMPPDKLISPKPTVLRHFPASDRRILWFNRNTRRISGFFLQTERISRPNAVKVIPPRLLLAPWPPVCRF